MSRSSQLHHLIVLVGVAMAAALLVGANATANAPTEALPAGIMDDGSPTAAARTVTPSPTVFGAQTLTAEHRASATRTGTATATPTAGPTIEPGTCLAITDKLAAEQAYLGDTIGITLSVRAICMGMRFPTHVVLVMDGSEAMAGQPNREMRDGAMELVRELDLDSFPTTSVAVVDSQERALRLCDLTNDESRILNCIRRVGATGTTSLRAGLLEASRVIRQGRRDLHPRESATELAIVFSQGCDDACCDEAAQGSSTLMRDGVLMISVCVGRDCNDRCMRKLTSAPRYFFHVEDLSKLVAVFEQIRSRSYSIYPNRVTVTDRLPDNMRYLSGSAIPEPTSLSLGSDVLVWQDVYMPREGVTYTFEVEPLELGRHPTNVEAEVELEANTGWTGTFAFAVPTVLVRARPTATALPEATPTASPTATDTKTPRPVDSPTPTVPDTAVWLPAVGR